MNNKQMITINENSIFYKIKRFFKKIFGNKNKTIENQDINANETQDMFEIEDNLINNNILVTPEKTNIIDKKTLDIESVKYNETIDQKNNSEAINQTEEKQEFLKQLDENRDMLKLLSIDRLKKLDNYYKDTINKNNDTINSLI